MTASRTFAGPAPVIQGNPGGSDIRPPGRITRGPKMPIAFALAAFILLANAEPAAAEEKSHAYLIPPPLMQLVQAFFYAAFPVVIAWLNDQQKRRAAEVKATTEATAEQVRLAAVEAAFAVKDDLARAERAHLHKFANLEQRAANLSMQAELSAKVAEATHKLVNGNMSMPLMALAVALRRIADMSKDPGDVNAAEAAERAFRAHETGIDEVRALPGTDDEKAGRVRT